MDRTLYIFFPADICPSCDHGMDFDISLCDNSINQEWSSRMCAPVIITLVDNYNKISFEIGNRLASYG